jgi:hypothetical protein
VGLQNLVRGRAMWVVISAIWLAATVTGLGYMAVYAYRPGPAAQAPARWPAESRLPRDPRKPTLIMLAHPRCDCTRASLTELAELMARVEARPAAFVVFIRPSRVPDDWEHTDLWRQASAIPGVAVVRDDDGAEAARFGAATSGETLVYGTDGRLLFEGGATAARGHVGDNTGFRAIVARLGGVAGDRATAPVYGCELFAPGDTAAKERRSDVR